MTLIENLPSFRISPNPPESNYITLTCNHSFPKIQFIGYVQENPLTFCPTCQDPTRRYSISAPSMEHSYWRTTLIERISDASHRFLGMNVTTIKWEIEYPSTLGR